MRPDGWNENWARRGAREMGLVAVCAVLIALPISALRAFYQPVDWFSFLTTTLVGLAYGSAFQGVFQWLLPGVLRLWPAAESRSSGFQVALGIVGLALAIGLGGLINELVMGWLNTSTAQHWFVGGSIVGIARLVQLNHQALERRIDEKELNEARWRDQASRAELQALQARVDPHFLFNSLNTVAGLIEEDPERAVDVVTRMAGLYRYTLRASREPAVHLRDEMEAVETFLEIHALRFEDRVSYEIDMESGIGAERVPPLCLQPLVENAVLHGLSEHGLSEPGSSDDRDPRRVHILVRAEAREARDVGGTHLRLVVEDDGPGPGASHHRGSGTALADLEERLALASDGRTRLITEARQPRGFRATIELPRLLGDGAPA